MCVRVFVRIWVQLYVNQFRSPQYGRDSGSYGLWAAIPVIIIIITFRVNANEKLPLLSFFSFLFLFLFFNSINDSDSFRRVPTHPLDRDSGNWRKNRVSRGVGSSIPNPEK